MFLKSNVISPTGQLFYSDSYLEYGENYEGTNQLPLLNRLAKIPVIGSIAGIVRILLSVIHTIGHLIAAICSCNRNHLPHAVKGITEILRGSIETVPLVGNIFAWIYDPGFIKDDYQCCPPKSGVYSRSFLVHIYHPKDVPTTENNLSSDDLILSHYLSKGKLHIRELSQHWTHFAI